MTKTRSKNAALLANEIYDILVRTHPAIRSRSASGASKVAGYVAAAILELPRRNYDQFWAIDPRRLESVVSHMLVQLVGDAPLVSEPPEVAADDSGRTLAPVSEWAGPVGGPTFLETNYGIARSTLHRWQKLGEVIALRVGGKRHVFPLEQFVDGRPVAGLDRVIKWFPTHRAAWLWLMEPNNTLRGRRPIEDLRNDNLDGVIRAKK